MQPLTGFLDPSARPGDLAVVAPNEAAVESYRRRLISILGGLDLGSVTRVVDCLFDAWQRRALVAIAGNGGSASTASHMANDLVKATRCDGKECFRAISLVDNVSLLTALANDTSYHTVFADQLSSLFGEGDLIVLLSASGESPNVLAAARRARELGGTSIALLGFSGGTLAEVADLAIHVETDRGDYGHVEDVHLALNHMITESLHGRIAASTA